MLVEFTGLLVYLVYHIDVATGRIVAKIQVEVVVVFTEYTFDVSVIIVHLDTPLLTISVLTTTSRALRVLNSDVHSVHLDMAFLIVAGFLLSFTWVSVHLLSLCLNFLRSRRWANRLLLVSKIFNVV